MIENIRLINFQSHQNSSLEFCDGVNVIVGLSRRGKTAILRALIWCAFNKPSGDSYRSHWGGDMCVSLSTDKGFQIDRVKEKSKNTYILYEPKIKKGQSVLKTLRHEYKAFGQSVPDAIKQLVNLDSVNIHLQHDPPFLLGMSPGEAAQYINSIVNLDIIGDTLSHINGMSRTTASSITSNQELLEETEEKSKQYAHLDDIEPIIKRLNQATGRASILRTEEMTLRNILNSIDDVETELEEIKKTDEAETIINNLIQINTDRTTLVTRHDELRGILESLSKETNKLDTLPNTKEAEVLVKKLLNLTEKREQLNGTYNDIDDVLTRINLQECRLEQTEETIKNLKAKEKKINPKGLCPVCGQKWK